MNDDEQILVACSLLDVCGVKGPPIIDQLAANAEARARLNRMGLPFAFRVSGFQLVDAVAAPGSYVVRVTFKPRLGADKLALMCLRTWASEHRQDLVCEDPPYEEGASELVLMFRISPKPVFKPVSVYRKPLTRAQKREAYVKSSRKPAGSKLARKAAEGKI